MIGGSIVLTICQIVMTIIAGLSDFHLQPPVLANGAENDMYDSTSYSLDSVGSSVVFVIVVYLFIFFYGCTWGPMGWIYPPELYSQGKAKEKSIEDISNAHI